MDNSTSFEHEDDHQYDYHSEDLLDEVQEFDSKIRLDELIRIIIAIIMRLLGVFFNSFFVRALWSRREHSSINFLLINLSIVDIIICSKTALTFLAHQFLNELIFGPFMCKTFTSSISTLDNFKSFSIAAALVGFLVKSNLSVLKMKQGIILMLPIALMMALPMMIFTTSYSYHHKTWCVFEPEMELFSCIIELSKVLLQLISVVLYLILPIVLRKTFIKSKAYRLLFGVVIFHILFISPRAVVHTLALYEIHVENSLIIFLLHIFINFDYIFRPFICVWLDEEIHQHVLAMIRRLRRNNSNESVTYCSFADDNVEEI